MNKLTKAVVTGVVAAVVTFLALLASGLGTTGVLNSDGRWVSMTTVNLGVNEFGILMILVVLITVVVTSYAFSAADKNKT
jgi:uncharacterized membrane protein